MRDDSSLICDFEIADFASKLSKSEVGEKIESRPLMIGWSTFTVGVYLRGESEEAEDHVSVFLFNESSWLVKATYKISVTGCVFGQSESSRTFHPSEDPKYPGWGFHQCIPHSRAVQHDLLDNNGTLTIRIELEIVDELIPGGLAAKKKESEELKAEVRQVSERVEGSLPAVQRDLLDIKNTLKKVMASLAEVECPLCVRRVSQSSVQQQCSRGHKLCGDCEEQVRARDNNNRRDQCVLCNISDLTKPSVLDKVIGTGAAIFHF